MQNKRKINQNLSMFYEQNENDHLTVDDEDIIVINQSNDNSIESYDYDDQDDIVSDSSSSSSLTESISDRYLELMENLFLKLTETFLLHKNNLITFEVNNRLKKRLKMHKSDEDILHQQKSLIVYETEYKRLIDELINLKSNINKIKNNGIDLNITMQNNNPDMYDEPIKLIQLECYLQVDFKSVQDHYVKNHTFFLKTLRSHKLFKLYIDFYVLIGIYIYYIVVYILIILIIILILLHINI